jgi:hypothetical protein
LIKNSPLSSVESRRQYVVYKSPPLNHILSQLSPADILSYGRANGYRVPVFYLPSVSYINPDFRLADYSVSHLLACWFLAELTSPTLKMEAICSSETSVDTQRTTRRHIPEDGTIQSINKSIYEE